MTQLINVEKLKSLLAIECLAKKIGKTSMAVSQCFCGECIRGYEDTEVVAVKVKNSH